MVTLFILILGFTPFLLSVQLMRQENARAQARLRVALEAAAARRLSILHLPPEHHYVDGVGFMIGDLTCQFNARSGYIRCAVNPIGPCQDCSQYQARD